MDQVSERRRCSVKWSRNVVLTENYAHKSNQRCFTSSWQRAVRNSGRVSHFCIVEKLNKIPSAAGNKCFSITVPLPREPLSLNSAKGGFQCWRETAVDYKKTHKTESGISSSETPAIRRSWERNVFQLVWMLLTWKIHGGVGVLVLLKPRAGLNIYPDVEHGLHYPPVERHFQ